jgi:hypothetical protein
VSVVCCQVEVSATNWSFVQRNPIDCGASLCVIKQPRTGGDQSPLPGCENTTTVGCNGRKKKSCLVQIQFIKLVIIQPLSVSGTIHTTIFPQHNIQRASYVQTWRRFQAPKRIPHKHKP